MIITGTDVFQALVQDRPYRQGMSLEKIITILDDMVASGKLDKEIVELIKKNGPKCFDIEKGNDPAYNLCYIDLFPERKTKT